MPYKLRREQEKDDDGRAWWADHSREANGGRSPLHWGARAYAVRYRDMPSAESDALKLAKHHGPIQVFNPYGGVEDTVVWSQEKETQAKVDEAVRQRTSELELKFRDDLRNETEAAKRRTVEEYARRLSEKDTEIAKLKAAALPQSAIPATCPAYYRIKIPWLKLELMVFDIIEALNFNFNLGCVLKYVLRAGKKTDALSDLEKARNCLSQEIERLKREPTKIGPVAVTSTGFVQMPAQPYVVSPSTMALMHAANQPYGHNG